ncbi:transcriptional regulator [Vreelandella alkaliphila]|uniref:Transcriptional regulator n=1 Tax=Vreelandella alkaliphila TaxID=272774 RepID=A0A7C9P115_9GAMM|nr:transcriptional regulator [Halomonas alkaliphila]NDL70493.1 transcriptional regulator [Halomonas alkaliphila]
MTDQPLGPKQLEEIGTALYGERWQSDMARALGIKDSRRIRAFMSEERSIPPGIWHELAALLRTRGKAALELADQLDSNIKAD